MSFDSLLLEIRQAANIDDFKNGSIRRQLFFLKQLGNSVLEKDELANLTNTITRMSSIYNKATVCPYKNPNCQENERLTLDPDISKRMAVSRDPGTSIVQYQLSTMTCSCFI